LGQDAIGRPETVKETRLELKRRFALAANVRDEQTAQLKQQAAQIQKVSAQLELTQSGTAAIKRRKASFAQLSEECKNSVSAAVVRSVRTTNARRKSVKS
jgi:hypothetical protein